MSQGGILTAIAILFVVEVNHLKWIWWTQWTCRACGHANRDCPCSEKWKWTIFL